MAGRRARRATLILCAGALLASCSDEKTKSRGELMLNIGTNLAITDDINQVGIEVFTADGQIINSTDRNLSLEKDGLHVPGTIALVPPNAGGQVVRVRVSGKKQVGNVQKVHVVREAIVKVPTDRLALLDMPLYWLCDQTTGAEACEEGESCSAGVCQKADVDVDELPDFEPGLVYGGGDEHGHGSYCLETRACFAGTNVVQPDDDCRVPLPDGADSSAINVALVLEPNSEGHCLTEAEGGTCYLPLDLDPKEGFAIDGDQIVLPKAACQRRSVTGIAVSTSCATKDLSVPICGPWTGWDSNAEGGAGGSTSTAMPTAGDANAMGGADGAGGVRGEAGVGVGPEAGASPLGAGGKGVGTAGASSNSAGGTTSTTEPCPIEAEAAPAYYSVLVDRSASLQTSIAAVNQALQQFATDADNAGTQFALQTTQAQCGRNTQQLLNFTALPIAELPQLQPDTQPSVFIDTAMAQTLQRLQAIRAAASRTMVVITGAVDATCGTTTDLMLQSVRAAQSTGISLRPLVIQRPNQAALIAGLSTQGSPAVVQLDSSQTITPQQVLEPLTAFRDDVASCSFVAPTDAYAVQVMGDGRYLTLTAVSSAAQCASNAMGYYKNGSIFTLCPSACAAKTRGPVQTESCTLGGGNSGAGGTTGSGAGGGGGLFSGGGSQAGSGNAGGGNTGQSTALCCQAHDGTGCGNTTVEQCVCQKIMPGCCTETWTAACVNAARQACAVNCP